MEAKENTEFLDVHEGEGFGNIGVAETAVPYLKIAQPLSPEMDKDEMSYLQGLELGMFYNSLTGKIYGDKINLVIVHFVKHWIEWQPNRGDFVAVHKPYSIKVDQRDFLKWKFGENDIKETYVYYCFVENHFEEGPIVYPLSGSGIKHAKNWNTLTSSLKLTSGKKAPLFAGVWSLQTERRKNAQGSWYQIGDKTSNIKRVRFITADEYADYLNPVLSDLKRLTDNVDFKKITDNTKEQVIDLTSYREVEENQEVEF